MNPWLGGAALLGKVPWYDEFLRPRGAPQALYAFDDWLFHNSGASEERTCARDAWHGFFVEGPSAEERAPRRHGVAGVLGPSHDRAGRGYALAVAAPLELPGEVAVHPQVTPILLEAYWNDALEVMVSARAGAPAEGDDRLPRLTERPIESPAVAVDLYTAWAERTPLTELCALLDKTPRWLFEAARAIARGVERDPRDALRVPLGRGAGGAVCFWIDVVRRFAAGRGHVPSFFWSHDDASGEGLVFPDAPGNGALAALWAPGVDRPTVCNLAADGAAREEGAEDESRHLHSGTVAAFLDSLGRRAR